VRLGEDFANDLSEDYLIAVSPGYQFKQMRAMCLMIASLNASVAVPVSIGAFQFKHIHVVIRGIKWMFIDLGCFDSGHSLCCEEFSKENKLNNIKYKSRYAS